jgi:hypothetical protein
MWLDELQAWLIARDSSSVIDLFKNLKYEGHPGLWHICLYLISRFNLFSDFNAAFSSNDCYWSHIFIH